MRLSGTETEKMTWILRKENQSLHGRSGGSLVEPPVQGQDTSEIRTIAMLSDSKAGGREDCEMQDVWPAIPNLMETRHAGDMLVPGGLVAADNRQCLSKCLWLTLRGRGGISRVSLPVHLSG